MSSLFYKCRKQSLLNNRVYRHFFMSMKQGVLYYDVKGKIIIANPAAGQILGVPVSHLLQKKDIHKSWTIITEQQAPLPYEEFPPLVCLQTGQEIRRVLGMYRADQNEYRWIAIHATPLTRAFAPCRVCVTLDDNTELFLNSTLFQDSADTSGSKRKNYFMWYIRRL